MALLVARVIAPASKLATHRMLRDETANWLRVFRGGRICLAAAPGLHLARPW